MNAADEGGGAEKIAVTIFHALRAKGNASWMAVGRRKTADPDVFATRDAAWKEAIFAGIDPLLGRLPGGARLACGFRRLSDPRNLLDRLRGREPFHYGSTRRLLDMTPESPDIIHCHNLHGGYFDLRELARLSGRRPVVITLHDEWTFTGHCAYTLGCERWRSACGQCPHLDVYPAIRRDGSAANLAAKRAIYAASRLYVVTPSHWLMGRVAESVLAPAIAGSKVIPNGIDLDIFRPGNQFETRRRLGVPEDALVLLFAANKIRSSPFKDYVTVRDAAIRITEAVNSRRVLLLALGDSGPSEGGGGSEIRHVPYQSDERVVADYYRAADLYLHAAHADNFPTTILEAAACGLPAVATAVGGIPEQIDSLDHEGIHEAPSPRYSADKATGVLVAAGDSKAMAEAAVLLLEAPDLRAQLSRNAARRAARDWSDARMVEDYLDLYQQIVGLGPRRSPAAL